MSGTKDPSSDLKRAVPQTAIIVRASNTAGVGGLLFIPSIKLEPRMDASAKVRIALPSGFVLLILLTHTIATCNAWTQSPTTTFSRTAYYRKAPSLPAVRPSVLL
jgi:hypothetical protein